MNQQAISVKKFVLTRKSIYIKKYDLSKEKTQMSRAKKVAHATPFLALNVPPKPRVLANDVITVAARAMDVLQQVRDAILMPHPRKNPPSFTTKELMDLLELDRNQLKAKEISIGKTFGSIKEGELKKHTL